MKAVWIRLAVVAGGLVLLTAVGLNLIWRYSPQLRQAAADRNKPPEQLRRERAAVEKIEQARRENVAEQRRALNAGEVDNVAGSAARMERAQTLLDAAAQQFRGDERTAMEVLQKHLSVLRAKTQAYEKAFTDLREVGFFTPESLPDLAALAERRVLAQRWLAANEELANCVRTLAADLRADLEEKLASRERVEEFARTFDRETHREQQLKIRDYDRQMGAAGLAQLDLLTAQWGAWKIAEDGSLRFEQSVAREKYEEQQRAMETAATAQVALQRELLAESERANGGGVGSGAATTRGSPTPPRPEH